MSVPDSISSNVTGLAIAKELSKKVLPGTPIWRAHEPNSYGETGAKIDTVSRQPINNLRQDLKGTTTDINVNANFNSDITQNNMQYLLEGLFCQAPFEKDDTLGINSAAVPCTSVATTGLFNAASGLSFLVNDLVLTSGFTNAANNGFGHITAITADTQIDTDIATVTEASPPASARIQHVGFQFTSADVVAASAGGVLTLTSTLKDVTAFNLQVGEWIFIGDDSNAAYSFPGCTGYARVLSVTTHVITCDKFTGTFTDGTASGKTIRIFFGTLYQNAVDPDDIIFPSYQIERQLGNDGTGVQSQYMLGSYADKLALKMPTANKIEADLSFLCLDQETVDGATGIKAGTRVEIPNEEAINTSTNLYRVAMSLVDGTLTPSTEFAYMTEINFNIDNGYKPNKAVGIIGAFGVSTGNFVAAGTLTAYFQTIAALDSIRNNDDITIDLIVSKHNKGFVIDFPLVTLGGGNLNIAFNAEVMVPLDFKAARCDGGYTASWTSFAYLPDIAMPLVA